MAVPRQHSQDATAVRRDLQRLRAELDRVARGSGGTTDLTSVEAELASLQAQIDALEADLASLSASLSGLWNFLVPPASPHAMDDEFTGGAFDSGKWATWNAGAISFTAAHDTTRKMLKLTAARQAGIAWAGVYQAFPSAQFTAYAYVSLAGGAAATAIRAALFATQDIAASPTTSDFVGVEVVRGAVNVSDVNQYAQRSTAWSAYNGGIPAATTAFGAGGSALLRLRVNGTSITGDLSYDGVGFHEIRTTTLASPTHVCLALHATGASGADGIAYVDFFRVFDGVSGPDDSVIGGFV